MKKLSIFLFILMIFTTEQCLAKERTRRTFFNPELAQLICKIAREYNIDPQLLVCIIRQESGFNYLATSPKGAKGLTQMISSTAKRFNIINPYDPEEALNGACRYLVFLINRYDGNLALVLAAYNAGEGAVDKYGKKIPPYPETINYVKSIMAAYKRTLLLFSQSNYPNQNYTPEKKRQLLQLIDNKVFNQQFTPR